MTGINSKPYWTASSELEDQRVDVAAIMREVRRRIGERDVRQHDAELKRAVDDVNDQWDKIYEPPKRFSRSLLGRLLSVIIDRLHPEVRSYLDPMIYRQTEFNASVVRALNRLYQQNQSTYTGADIEALRDEIIQLRERVRQLEERDQE